MDVVDLHRRAVTAWVDRVRTMGSALSGPTPCAEWDVRALVNHVVGEDRWTSPLVGGATIAEVGDRFDGDLLGDDPLRAAEEAGREATEAFAAPDSLDRIVHLSFGDAPAEEYAWQLIADHLVHGWDLAAATGGERTLDEELVEAVADWFAGREDVYREAGVIGPRPQTEAHTAQDRLLVSTGRDPRWQPS